MKTFINSLILVVFLLLSTPTHAEVCIQGNDNVCPPLNTSTADQAKNGNLEALRLRATQTIVADKTQSYTFPTGDKALNLVSLTGIGAPKYCDQNGNNCFTPAQISTLLTPNSTPTCTNGTLANNVCTCPTTYPTLIAGNCYNLGTSATSGDLTYVKRLTIANANTYAPYIPSPVFGDGDLLVQRNTYVAGKLCIQNGTLNGNPKWECKTGAEWAKLGNDTQKELEVDTWVCSSRYGCEGLSCTETGSANVVSESWDTRITKSTFRCELGEYDFCTFGVSDSINQRTYAYTDVENGNWVAYLTGDSAVLTRITCKK